MGIVSILFIVCVILTVVLLALLIFNVPVSQKAVNTVFCVIILLLALANSGWLK